MKRRVAKNIGLLVLMVAVAHFMSVGIIRVERFLIEQFTAAKAVAVEVTAETLGLEKKQIIDAFTAEQLAEREALRAQLNPALVRAVMRIESTNERYATSPVGAIGLMQIMPANAKHCADRRKPMSEDVFKRFLKTIRESL